MSNDVILFQKDLYSTHKWTPLLFWIHNDDLPAVRYYIEHKQVNKRLATKKKELRQDETEYEAEIFPLILAISNESEAMFDYFWYLNELWNYEHLKLAIQVIFSRTMWVKGVEIILSAEATQDIYNSLSYKEKKQFLVEVFYRYLHHSNDKMKQVIRECLIKRPYSIISMHFLLTELQEKNIPAIRAALEEITIEDYAKMKYNADKEFMESWNTAIKKFEEQGEAYAKITKAINK